MTDKQSGILSFHQVREQCEQGGADVWRSFLTFYSPLCLQLARIYTAGDAPVWERTLEGLMKDNFAQLRAMQRQTEREFLMDVRTALFDCALAEAAKKTSAEPSASELAAPESPTFNIEKVTKILDGLPLLHQEILWFKLAGYTDATIERILRMAPSVAHGALDRLGPDFAAARDLASDHCLWPEAWLDFLRQARAAKKEECPPLHQLLRIHDGQVSWYDKEPMERKVASCLHCLDSWTGLREVAYWRRAAPGVSPDQIEQLLRKLPLIVPEEKKSLFGRLFKK